MTDTCRKCSRFIGGVCRADSDQEVNPRGDCPSFDRPADAAPSCPEHAALIEALMLLLKAYPKLWYQQADSIARVLQATKRAKPDWRGLADQVHALKKWCPTGHRRAFVRACCNAGARI